MGWVMAYYIKQVSLNNSSFILTTHAWNTGDRYVLYNVWPARGFSSSVPPPPTLNAVLLTEDVYGETIDRPTKNFARSIAKFISCNPLISRNQIAEVESDFYWCDDRWPNTNECI